MEKGCGRGRHEGTNGEQDRKGFYQVTLRRVRATILAVGKQKAIHIRSVCM